MAACHCRVFDERHLHVDCLERPGPGTSIESETTFNFILRSVMFAEILLLFEHLVALSILKQIRNSIHTIREVTQAIKGWCLATYSSGIIVG